MKFTKNFDKKYWKISKYVLGTSIALMVLVFLFINIKPVASAIGGVLNWIGAVLKPVIIGAVIAYIVYPIVRFYEHKLPGKLKKHSIAVAATILTFIIVLGVLITIVTLAVTKKVSALTQLDINTLATDVTRQFKLFEGDLKQWLQSINVPDGTVADWEQSLLNSAKRFVNNSSSNIGFVINIIKDGASTALFAIMFAVYFMLDIANLKKYWGAVVRKISSQKVNNFINLVLSDADKAFSGYFRGQALDALFMATMISVLFSIAGVRYGVLIGVMTGIGNLVPYLGPVFGYGLTLITGLITGTTDKMIIGIIIVAVLQGIDGAIVNPKLLSSSVKVHPMLVLVALIAGGKIGGLVGMLVAVPTAALLKVWFERWIDRRGKEKGLNNDGKPAKKPADKENAANEQETLETADDVNDRDISDKDINDKDINDKDIKDKDFNDKDISDK
jgi:predicted PurR-regulated permease PerM